MSCLACHPVIDRQLRTGTGYHGRAKRTGCISCHHEHQGRSHQLVTWPGGREAFDHRLTGFVLQGKHAGLECRRCHEPGRQRDPLVLRFSAGRRQNTFLGLRQECNSCHHDPHRGAAGPRCQRCHEERLDRFKAVNRFVGHERGGFPLRGRHQKLPCARCHQRQNVWRFKGTSADCASCHPAPHRGTMGQPGSSQRLACAACHNAEGWSPITFARTSHPSSVPLHGGHGRVACRKCHGPKGNDKPKGAQCASCHQDLHQLRFGQNCSKCHGSSSWQVNKGKLPVGPMNRAQQDSARLAGIPTGKLRQVSFHNQTSFPLTGRHITVPCQRCHRKGRRKGQRTRIKYTRRFVRCADCHEDEHRGQFQRHVTKAGRVASACEACHPLGGLAVTSFSVERHDATRFPLKGAHRAAPCSACHHRRRPAAKRFTYESRDCAACHRDPHRGRFQLSAQRGEPLPCATCHEETSFKRITFDHAKTRFPLKGRHARISCDSCHRPDARGVTTYRGVEPGCQSCHPDPHRGQFAAVGPPTACRQCHDERGFQRPTFDHARTRFPLAGAHRQVPCKRCHHQVTLADSSRTTLYRLGSTACVSCHASPHGKRRSSRTRTAAGTTATAKNAPPLQDCARCHQETDWRRQRPVPPAGFDHARVGYPLRGRHRAAACGDCHQPQRATRRQCGTCHQDPHRGRLGTTCADCHTPESWRPSEAHARHRRTRLPLTGWHALADCSSCHPRARERGFRGVPAACYGCHAAAYNDPRTHPDHRRAGYDTRCETCHRPTGWSPALFTARSSALRQPHAFPLTGRHARLDCAACHARGRRPPTRCEGCHDQLRRQVRSPSHTAAGFPRDCGRCHRDSGWQPARAASSHRGFPLRGNHRVPCQSCHTDDADFRRYSCITCHDRITSARQHRRVPGYLHQSQTCRRCHPLGTR